MAVGEVLATAGKILAETGKRAAEVGTEVAKESATIGKETLKDTSKTMNFTKPLNKLDSPKIKIEEKLDLTKKSEKTKNISGLDTSKPLDLTKQNDVKDLSLEKIKNDYIDDMKSKSEFTFDIDKNAIMKQKFEKISPEVVSEKRLEFKQLRGSLRNEWEKKNGVEWPRYKTDVYDNGTCIRKAGQMYDAHHKQPLEFGGKNEVQNITPFHVKEHYDSRGIHSKNSPFKQLEKALGDN